MSPPLRHRKSKGYKAANFHESVTVEIAWTVIPFLIVIVMGAMATRTVVAQKVPTSIIAAVLLVIAPVFRKLSTPRMRPALVSVCSLKKVRMVAVPVLSKDPFWTHIWSTVNRPWFTTLPPLLTWSWRGVPSCSSAPWPCMVSVPPYTPMALFIFLRFAGLSDSKPINTPWQPLAVSNCPFSIEAATIANVGGRGRVQGGLQALHGAGRGLQVLCKLLQ